jgi:hypothetical protein
VLTSITPLLRLGLRALLGWLDERTQAPIMRQYINDGSRRYFHREQSERGASEFDELLAEPAWAELPNPRRDDASANMTTSRALSASWLRVVGYVALGTLATLWLLAASGHGPFARAPLSTVGKRLEQGVLGAIGLWLALTRGRHALQEARALTRARRAASVLMRRSTPRA